MATSSFDYKFVLPVPEEYMCPICQCPMKEPVQTKCGHRFCKHCLGKAMRRTPECPIDRTPLNHRRKKDIYPDVAIERTIMDYRVRCSNEGDGCSWIGELRSMEKHAAGCSFTRVMCTNESCEATPFKRELHRHVTKECPRRSVECIHCRTSYVWCLRQSHFGTCHKYPCSCLQDCGLEKIPRNEMNDHIEKICPRTEVDCTYSHVGCQVKVQRSALSQHVNDNVDCHLSLACAKLQLLHAEIVGVNENMEELSATVPRNESIQDLRAEVCATSKEVKNIQTGHEVLRNEFEEVLDLEADVEAINRRLQDVQAEQVLNKLACAKLQLLHAEIVGVNENMEELSANVPRNESIQDLRAEVCATSKEVKNIQAGNEVLRNEFEEVLDLEADVEAINRRLQDVQAEQVRARKTVLKNQNRISRQEREQQQPAMNARVYKMEETLYRMQLRTDRMQLRTDSMAETLEEVNTRVQQTDYTKEEIFFFVFFFLICMIFGAKELKELQAKLENTTEQLQKLQAPAVKGSQELSHDSTCRTSSFIWKFTQFESRLKQAKNGKETQFFSEPFHIGPSSYKMCIALYPNGFGKARHTHLSVFAFLLRSDIDAVLPWPFKKKVMFTLIDQQADPKQRRDVRAVAFSKETTHLGNPLAKPSKSTERKDGFGFPKFISHGDLKTRHYVVCNTLYLEVEVDINDCR